MLKKPFINAVSAGVYIVIIVSIMQFLSRMLKDKPDTFGAPITFLFLFTLSAAVMAYLFLYQPLQLFLEGKKKEATNLFIHTVGIFAGFTIIILALLLLGVI